MITCEVGIGSFESPDDLGADIDAHIRTYYSEDDAGFWSMKEEEDRDTGYHANAAEMRLCEKYRINFPIVREAITYELARRNLDVLDQLGENYTQIPEDF